MKVQKTEFPGLLIIDPVTHSDSRGYFFESYNSKSFRDAGLYFTPVQDNESCSSKGVLRGLHYQREPFAQAKLIRVVEGEIFDVALDMRIGSPTFGKWFGIIIDSGSKRQFYIPQGFAHGFSVLSEKAIVLYKCDTFYSAHHEGGINVKDPSLNIDWKIPAGQEIISAKDLIQPLFSDVKSNFLFKG